MPPDDTRPLSADTFPAEREWVISRQLPASPEALFDAWTRPSRLAAWWGPEGFTLPVVKSDPRPGGAFLMMMRSPEGLDFHLRGVYQESSPPRRLVLRIDLHEHLGEWHGVLQSYHRDTEGHSAPGMLWITSFDAREGGTLLTFRVRFDSRTERHAALKMGLPEAWTASLERLARLISAP